MELLVASVLRNFLIFPFLPRLLFADLITFDTCADIFMFGSKTAYTGELGYDGPLYNGFLHMTDDMLGTSPMHIKYSSYVYDGFCIWRTHFPGPIESVISKFTCIYRVCVCHWRHWFKFHISCWACARYLLHTWQWRRCPPSNWFLATFWF